MKNEIVGINHLKEVTVLLLRARNLLNQGKDVLPFNKWQDSLTKIREEIEEHIIEETKLNIGE